MAVECLPGHRLIQQEDLAVGKTVVYVSRDPGKPNISTVIVDAKIMPGNNLNLKHKSVAPMKRVFVALADVGAEAAEDSPQVGAEAAVADASLSTKDSSKAAVGAQAAVGATTSSAEGLSNMDVDKDAPGNDPDQFLKMHIIPWLNQLEQNAVSNAYSMPECLAAALSTSGESPEELVQAFKEKVPWLPCVNFQSVPKHSKKGHIHISMLSYNKASYAANGLFVGDAKLLLCTEGFHGLERKTVAVKPRPGAKMTCFGWEADGAVVNGTYAFSLTSIVAYSVIYNCTLPQPLAQLLQSIPVQFTKHDSNQNRLLQNLVESAAQRHSNRTVQCPIFLAEELNRCTFQLQYVKAFVKLYQQRMVVSPALQLPPRMEDCVIRLMTDGKTCKAALKMLSRSVAKFTWTEGPWLLGHILSPYFAVGSSLNNSMHEQWALWNVQTPLGQTIALEIGYAGFETNGKKFDCEDEWSVVLVACGLWVNLREKLIPSLLMSESAIEGLDKVLRSSMSFRADLAAVSARDPPANMSAVGDLASWLLTQVSELRRAKQEDDAATRLTGDNHPSKLLGDKEAAELAAYNYVSGCMLDVETYRQAMDKFGEETECQEEQWRKLYEAYVGSLTRMHDAMQRSDVVFWEPPQRVGMKRNKDWLSKAVVASVAHRRILKTILGVRESDICQVNVFALYSLGTAKKNILQSIAQSLPQLPGMTLVFFPVIPKKLKRVTGAAAAVGASAADGASSAAFDSQSGSDSDVDPEGHDFNSDGMLPEALTSLHTVKTSSERSAQLAADCHEVSTVVGMADINERYPRALHFIHRVDESGGPNTTSALLLVPTHDAPGVNVGSLSESQALRSGTYTEVPVPSEWIKVSKKLAMQAKRVMAEKGMMDVSTCSAVGGCGVKYGLNKVARAQLGTELHEMWIRDLSKHCGAKVLYICDFAHGGGEIMKASITSKVSEEACSTGVRVCSWGSDPRKIFAEIGRAVGRTELSKLFIRGKLVVPGHRPGLDPGSRPERTRKLIKALLPQQMKCLALDTEGRLVIPTADEIAKACPVALDEEQHKMFARWRVDFPREVAAAPETSKPPEASKQTGANNTQCKTPEPGTQVTNEAKLKEDFGDEVVSEQPLAAGGSAATNVITLALGESQAADGAQKCLRVWLRNKSTKNVTLPVSTLLGQGGQGKIVSLVSTKLEDGKDKFAWRYTRLTGYKKDTAELANGYMIFNKEGTPLEGKPKLSLLSDIENELGNNLTVYGHAITRGGTKVVVTPSPSPVVWVPAAPAVGGSGSGIADFSASTLGQYVCAHEDTSGLPKCKGLCRPIFEYKTNPSSGGTGYGLVPGAPTGKSALWLFSVKKIEVPAGGFVFLG